MNDSAKKLLKVVAIFAGHVLGGIFFFGLVALAAVLLHFAIGWLSAQGIPSWMLLTLTVLEYSLFIADVIVFAVWILATLYDSVGHIVSIVKTG